VAAALLVIVSRVYVGTLHASDVLGGAVTGIIAAAVVLTENAIRGGVRGGIR
jgi:undecaprenyl-diphosphatase